MPFPNNIIVLGLAFFQDFFNPYTRYRLLEPLLTWGLGFTLLFFLLGTVMGEKKIQLTALILFILCCFSVIPFKDAREQAEHELKRHHTKTAHVKLEQSSVSFVKYDIVFIAVGILGIVTAIFMHGKMGTLLRWLTIAAGIGLLIFSANVSFKEIKASTTRMRPDLK